MLQQPQVILRQQVLCFPCCTCSGSVNCLQSKSVSASKLCANIHLRSTIPINMRGKHVTRDHANDSLSFFYNIFRFPRNSHLLMLPNAFLSSTVSRRYMASISALGHGINWSGYPSSSSPIFSCVSAFNIRTVFSRDTESVRRPSVLKNALHMTRVPLKSIPDSGVRGRVP